MEEENIRQSNEPIKIVLDTSVIIGGLWRKILKEKKFAPSERLTLIIPEVVISEIEHLANIGKAIGYAGLRELENIRKMAEDKKINSFLVVGERPTLEQIKLSTGGELDHLIRQAAKEHNAILVTADIIQSIVGKIIGLDVKFLKEYKGKGVKLEDFFDKTTMSIHLKEGVIPYAKRGGPGKWKLIPISDKPISKRMLEKLAIELIENARTKERILTEIDEPGATVIQMGYYRIAICRPPFSERLELTVVRPILKVSLDDYKLSKALKERFKTRAEGILVSGPPGAGKTTFVQALAEFYHKQGYIVKTIEKPRDLQVPAEVTQYTALAGDIRKTIEVLLLVRPDYTIFDEMRHPRDFGIFADLRFGGVGMVGVVHSASAIDAIQRFIGKVELGQLSQIIDTVIFIKEGKIEKVYSLSLVVKVPTGMLSEDLARPVIEVRDFETKEIEYEIYSFGEQVVVAPIDKISRRTKSPVFILAEKYLQRELTRQFPGTIFKVQIVSEGEATIIVDEKHIPHIIGKSGKTIDHLEKKFGLRLNVRAAPERLHIDSGVTKTQLHHVDVKSTKNHIVLRTDREFANKTALIYSEDKPLFTAIIGRNGEIRIRKKTEEGKILKKNIEEGSHLYIEVI